MLWPASLSQRTRRLSVMTSARQLPFVTVRLRQPQPGGVSSRPRTRISHVPGSLVKGVCHEALSTFVTVTADEQREAADDDEDLEPRCASSSCGPTETFDGQERVMSRAAYDLQVLATAHSASCGHPGFVPDDYLEHLDGLASRPRSPRLSCAPSACGSESTAATASWTGKPSKYALTRYASAEGKTSRPSPGNANARPSPGPHGPADGGHPAVRGHAEPRQHASSSSPPDTCPPTGSNGPAPCRTASSGNASPDSGTCCSKASPPDNGYGDPIDASRAGRIAQAFRPPLCFAQVHTAGFYDDAGFCQDCDAPYCYRHWRVSESGYGYCPRRPRQEPGPALVGPAAW